MQAGNAARAFGIFRAMRDAQLAPDEATYGALLHACGKVGDAARAERLFADMRAAGVPQGVLTFTPLMHANVTCSTPESLARVFQARPALPWSRTTGISGFAGMGALGVPQGLVLTSTLLICANKTRSMPDVCARASPRRAPIASPASACKRDVQCTRAARARMPAYPCRPPRPCMQV